MLLTIGAILWFISNVSGQTCGNWENEYDCITDSAGACLWVDKCQCASEVSIDLIFAIDISGSIGWTDFQTEKVFIENLVTKGLGSDTRIGFDMFSTNTNLSRSLQVWDDADLLSYVRGIRWTGGWTNTGDVLAETLTEFDENGDDSRLKMLMIVTDGNPCLPQSGGGCPQSVCSYSAQITQDDVRVIVIGVGSGWETKYVECLVQDADDVILVEAFTDEDFNELIGNLADTLCPLSLSFVVTEVKPQINTDCTRCDRFVEIYNDGISFFADTLTLEGLITGTGTTVEVPQGSYVVFYDAETGWDGSTADPGNGIVTCHKCDASICELDLNTDGTTCLTGDLDSNACFCDNSVYIPCGSGEGCTGYTCCFDNDMDKTTWNIVVKDEALAEVDSVVYDTGTWDLVVDDGYAYELIAKGFDNDVPGNWVQSCSTFGTPGSDPSAECTPVCTTSACNGECNGYNQCECDALTGYYPSCTGGACTSCSLIPEMEQCTVIWTKNGTDKYAYYSWTDTDYDGIVTYKLSYFSQSQGGSIL
eukprot:85451_1